MSRTLLKSVLFTISFFLISCCGTFAQCFSGIPYPINDPCVQTVIAVDPFCCVTSWDSACQNAYDNCDPGSGGGGGPIVVSSSTYSVEELVTDVLLGSCVEASNITWSGADAAFGNFSGGNSLGFAEGIIISTGNATGAPGPETIFSSTSHSNPGDPELDNLLSGITTNDAAIIEFDFVSPTNFVSFEYVFASEEYEDFTCDFVNDAFGFFITGPGYAPGTNVALVPGTTTPVSINSVNQGYPSGFSSEGPCLDMDPNYSAYSIYYNDNISPVGQEIAYGGFTTVFTVELDLEPCQTYHIKLAIGDGGDWSYDSAVFLKAGSFTSGLEVEVVPGTSNASVDALEGCQDGYFMFINQGPAITEPTVFNFDISGSATVGDDYAPIDNYVTFEPGQDTVIVHIEAFLDGITEGTEDIILTFPDICTCDAAPEAVLNILDNDALTAEISENISICTGTEVTLEVLNATGSESQPYSYLWSNGATTPSIDVAPVTTTTYTADVTDACGGQNIEFEVTVTVSNEITVDAAVEICLGDSYEMPDGSNAFDSGLYTFEYVTSLGCDSIINVDLSVVDIPVTNVQVGICDGESYELPDGSEVSLAGTYDVMLASVLGCDSLVSTELEIWPIYEIDEEIAICEGSFYTLPDGTDVSVAGIHTVELQTINGCDSIIHFELEVNPNYEMTEGAAICGDGGYVLPDGSMEYTSGEYTVTLNTIHGCDSVITTILEVQDLITIDLSVNICDNEIYTLPDGTSTGVAGNYEVMIGSDDCDTLYLVELEIFPTYNFTQTDSICAGENYVLSNGNIVTTSGIYQVVNQSQHGCDSIQIYELTVLPKPMAGYSATPTVASIYDGPVSFHNQSTGATQYEWNFETIGNFDSEHLTIDFEGVAGEYPLCLTVINDFGCVDQLCRVYEVRENFVVYIPTAFTPNGDGINDLFFVEGRDIDPNNFLLQVFNRNGEIVFESTDPTLKWDGGEPAHEYYAQNEVYVYRVVIGALANSETREFTGNVTAIR